MAASRRGCYVYNANTARTLYLAVSNPEFVADIVVSHIIQRAHPYRRAVNGAPWLQARTSDVTSALSRLVMMPRRRHTLLSRIDDVICCCWRGGCTRQTVPVVSPSQCFIIIDFTGILSATAPPPHNCAWPAMSPIFFFCFLRPLILTTNYTRLKSLKIRFDADRQSNSPSNGRRIVAVTTAL